MPSSRRASSPARRYDWSAVKAMSDCRGVVSAHLLHRNRVGGGASQLRRQRGLLKKANVRDALTVPELALVSAAGALSSERIVDPNQPCSGDAQCVHTSERSALFI